MAMKLEIVTPEKMVFSHDAELVTLPGVEGEFGVLANHAPLIAELQAGEINVYDKAEGGMPKAKFKLTGGGFAQVTEKSCSVLSDSCEEITNSYSASKGNVTDIKKKK